MLKSLLVVLLLVVAPLTSAAAEPTRFSVTVEGEGPDLILIPGLTSGRHVWDESVAGLGGRYRVHRLQIAGFAGEPAGANADSAVLAGVVEELHAYIADNKLARPAIAGHSIGGLMALMLAARHPDDVGRVLVVDALPFYSLLFGPTATVEAAAPRAAGFRDGILAMDAAAYRAQQEQVLGSLVKAEAARPLLLQDSVRSDRRVVARAMYEAMTTDARPELGRIKAPLTVLYATNSFAPEAMVGPLYRSAYANAPEAKLVAVDDSYHFVMLDQPARFGQILAEFLKGQ